MFISPDADGNEAATGISRALGMALIGWRQSADTMSDWVVESMQEIVIELKKEQRRLFLNRYPRSLGTLSATYRRQVAARRPELAFTSRSVEEP
jgi:hemolysin-activating ACP:hemolysin acyltransferase